MTKYYNYGFEQGKMAANDTNWKDGEMAEKLEDEDLGEVVEAILDNWRQMAGTIYYEDGITNLQLDQFESGFFNGFEAQVKKLIGGLK